MISHYVYIYKFTGSDKRKYNNFFIKYLPEPFEAVEIFEFFVTARPFRVS